MKAEKVVVVCPKCGHTQSEPAAAYSSICKQCHQHFRIEEVLHPTGPAPGPKVGKRRVTCFQCSTELDVPVAAFSTMCKRCGTHVDLHDYSITNAVSKNFRTKGRFVIEPTGFLFNTDSIAGEAIIKGRLLGRLTAERSLEIYTGAEIKGGFTANQLIIPGGQRFRWPEIIRVGSADLAGELSADLHATGTVTLRANARLFGSIQAGGLVVEEGAVLVGNCRIGAKP